MKRLFTWPRAVLAAAIALGLAAWWVPKISADRFREPIHQALGSALGRKVEIGQVRFQLLPAPGFTIDNVFIGEDPAVGAEPAAYITRLRARPRISSLFGGPLAFASVDLEDASLNLTRVDRDAGVRWNFTSLMRPKLPALFPSVHMSGGRVNFKFGDTKSIFYLLDTDIDLWPPSEADGAWTLKVRANPARTDRPARGFGSFVARGQWMQRTSSLTLDVRLEKSELSDVVTLFEGRESSVYGHIWGDAHLAGPLGRVGVSGRMTLEQIHAWDQPPPAGNAWPFSIGGAIDLPGQTISLRATTGGKDPPLDIRYRVADYLGRPRWSAMGIFSAMPLAPVLSIARHLGVEVPGEMSFEGTARGAVSYSAAEGVPRMDGYLAISDGRLALAGSEPLRVPEAGLRFSGSAIELPSVTLTNSANQAAMLTASYDISSRRLDASLTSDGMSIPSLRGEISAAGAPLLSQATEGTWSGTLGYSNSPAGPAWNGAVHLKDADIPFEAFARPLHLRSAEAVIDSSGIAMKRLTVVLGAIEAQGEYRYETGAPRPHRFHLSLGKIDGAAIEKLLLPALHRGNFLTYAFNFGRVPEPGWLRTMGADGTVQVAGLEIAGELFARLKARVLWDGDEVRFSGLQGSIGGAAFTGVGDVNLARREPEYRVSGKLAGWPWRTGTMDAEGTLRTTGTGAALLANMNAGGSFRANAIDLSPLNTWDTIDGCFDWAWDARNPRLKLTQLVMATPGNTFLGSAETQDNGELVLRASDGTKQIQAAGLLFRGDGLKPVGR